MLPAIFGTSGLTLTADERDFFRAAKPLGFIVFGRNIASREQLYALTCELRMLTGRSDLPILIDQEGGRVARLKPPEWCAYPAATVFGELWQQNACAARRATALNYEALALELAEVGINVDCAPVLDVPVHDAHDIIGDRAFADTPEVIAELGEACLSGLSAAGVIGVVKHIPGHGRATADSHQALPEVSATVEQLEQDIAPFARLAQATMAMTAHIRYRAWDSENCATLSPTIISRIIRGQIGFDGLLMSDDLDMKALRGSVAELALTAIDAGCDVALNCWGRLDDMEAIAQVLPSASADCQRRLAAAFANVAAQPSETSQRRQACLAERDLLFAQAGLSSLLLSAARRDPTQNPV